MVYHIICYRLDINADDLYRAKNTLKNRGVQGVEFQFKLKY